MTTRTKQANFLLPEDLLNDLKTSVPIRQQSEVVTEALRKEMKRIKLQKRSKIASVLGKIRTILN